VIMFDLDPEPEAPHCPASAGALMDRLAMIWPEFAQVGWLATSSTSSAIRSVATQEWLVPPHGMHVYTLATGDVARWREIAKVRLWLAGEGYCKLASPNPHTGVASILLRALIDLTVFSPERLDYVAGALYPDDVPFYQDRPPPELHHGLVLDLDRLPDVTDDERQAAAARIQEAKDQLAPKQRHIVREHIRRESFDVRDIEHEIDDRIQRAARRELLPDHPLYFDNGARCTAGTLTAAHDDKWLSDPLEPDYGPNKAVCHWNKGHWRIVSWAHGLKRTFRLVQTEPTPPVHGDPCEGTDTRVYPPPRGWRYRPPDVDPWLGDRRHRGGVPRAVAAIQNGGSHGN
jgi:hypothetical protein